LCEDASERLQPVEHRVDPAALVEVRQQVDAEIKGGDRVGEVGGGQRRRDAEQPEALLDGLFAEVDLGLHAGHQLRRQLGPGDAARDHLRHTVVWPVSRSSARACTASDLNRMAPPAVEFAASPSCMSAAGSTL
jgi:hypothetical protein